MNQHGFSDLSVINIERDININNDDILLNIFS